ncbi:MAG: hypothetical protein HY735_01345 [Verrucomicrobia bacterium]|nr:hypothetical protein [Verrucomicrobiota bacterium]
MKKASLHSCNVLAVEPQGRRLWQFHLGNGQVKLASHQSHNPGEPFPPRLCGKNWRTLWQPKLNVAWLPADQVFLRVVHLPAAEPAEFSAMVEFQLEKLSPLPVNQVVWSMEVGPPAAENLQTIIVVIAARGAVEDFLGGLEEDGYLADRLELPALHQLISAPPEGDSVCISPVQEQDRLLCIVAWWCGGTLQQIQMLHFLAAAEAPALLIEQLTKTAWAGEMEGWLKSRLRCFLVAEAEGAAPWESCLRDWSDEPAILMEPTPKALIAELSAKKAAAASAESNLLPQEYRTRYRQQFVDRLWLTGLGALLAAYLLGVLAYFGGLQVLRFQKHRVESQVAALSQSFTNAVRLKARADVLQNQLNLKYAALDCLRAASERLLGGLTLTRFAFSKGQGLRLEGTAEKGDDDKITEYNSALRKETVNGEPLFAKVEAPTTQVRGQSITWQFNCELNRPETE